MPAVPRVDPELAAEAFTHDLDQFWASGRPTRWGWSMTRPDPLTALLNVTGMRGDGILDEYRLLLDASSYDDYPPGVYFVRPDPPYARPAVGSRWLPSFGPAPFEFGFHPVYQYPDQISDQLVCFSQSRDYYISGHNPQPGQRWQPGVHTVAATLNRLHEVLSVPCYQGHSGDLDT
jgi:hypothetical protein